MPMHIYFNLFQNDDSRVIWDDGRVVDLDKVDDRIEWRKVSRRSDPSWGDKREDDDDEGQKDERLRFLNFVVDWSNHGRLEYIDHTRPTPVTHMHSDKYLPFDSHRPLYHKNSVSRTLLII